MDGGPSIVVVHQRLPGTIPSAQTVFAPHQPRLTSTRAVCGDHIDQVRVTPTGNGRPPTGGYIHEIVDAPSRVPNEKNSTRPPAQHQSQILDLAPVLPCFPKIRVVVTFTTSVSQPRTYIARRQLIGRQRVVG